MRKHRLRTDKSETVKRKEIWQNLIKFQKIRDINEQRDQPTTRGLAQRRQ